MIRNEEDTDLRKHMENKTRTKFERKQRNLLREIARGKCCHSSDETESQDVCMIKEC